MTKETFHLPMINVSENRFPFVEGAFKAKNGQMLKGYFLVDSGSMANMLSKELEQLVGDEAYTGEKQGIGAVDRKGEVCPVVNIEIEMDGMQSKERFCISYNIDFVKTFGDHSIFGIIGIDYLLKHKLVLDFENQCLRSVSDENIELTDLSFLCPMKVGIEAFGSPVVAFVKDGEEYFCVPDSGTDNSLIADGAFKGVISHEMLDARGSVSGISGTNETGYAKASFSLISVDDTGKMGRMVEREEVFMVLPEHEYIFQEENRLPVSALLSTPFMLRNKWILDFGQLGIYSRK